MVAGEDGWWRRGRATKVAVARGAKGEVGGGGVLVLRRRLVMVGEGHEGSGGRGGESLIFY